MSVTTEVQEPTTDWDRHREKMAELRGDTDRPTPEDRCLDAILSVALGHDRVCQYLEDRLYREIGVRGGAAAEDIDDGPLNEYLFEVVELCARLAPFARQRVPAPLFADAVADTGAIQSLTGGALVESNPGQCDGAGAGDREQRRVDGLTRDQSDREIDEDRQLQQQDRRPVSRPQARPRIDGRVAARVAYRVLIADYPGATAGSGDRSRKSIRGPSHFRQRP